MNFVLTNLELNVLKSIAQTGYKRVKEITIENLTFSEVYDLLLHMQKMKLIRLTRTTVCLSDFSKAYLNKVGVTVNPEVYYHKRKLTKRFSKLILENIYILAFVIVILLLAFLLINDF